MKRILQPVTLLAAVALLYVVVWGQNRPNSATQPSPAPAQTFPNLSTAPADGDHFQFRELLSTTSQRVCSRSTLDVVRTSATVLTMGGSASATVPEYVRLLTTDYLITATATATLSLGGSTDNGTVYIYGDSPGGTAGVPGTPHLYVLNPLPVAAITCGGTTGCVVVKGQLPPAGTVLIWTWSVASGNWVSSGGADLRTNRTCDIDLISCADFNGGNHAITLSDGQSSPLPIIPTVIPNTTVNNVLEAFWPGGTRADNGATWLADTNSSIYCSVRGVIR